MGPAVSISTYLLSLPLEFLRWWFIDATINLLRILRYYLAFFYQLFGVASIFKTFFKPWKNEYREGLVGFSIFMGIFFKTLFLIIDSLFLVLILVVEMTILAFWIASPFLILGGLYAGLFT